jgi:hypothetical protein
MATRCPVISLMAAPKRKGKKMCCQKRERGRQYNYRSEYYLPTWEREFDPLIRGKILSVSIFGFRRKFEDLFLALTKKPLTAVGLLTFG